MKASEHLNLHLQFKGSTSLAGTEMPTVLTYASPFPFLLSSQCTSTDQHFASFCVQQIFYPNPSSFWPWWMNWAVICRHSHNTNITSSHLMRSCSNRNCRYRDSAKATIFERLKGAKGANFDAGNFSLIEIDVLDMMQSKTHFWQIGEIMYSGSEPMIYSTRVIHSP